MSSQVSMSDYARGLLDAGHAVARLLADSAANVRPDEIEELDDALSEIGQSTGATADGTDGSDGAVSGVQIVARLAADGTLDAHESEPITLGDRLSADTLIAGLDAWTAANRDYRPFKWRWGPHGPPIARAHVVSVTAEPRLSPEAVTDHVWNNLHGASKTHYATSLTKSITLEDSSTVDTKLTVGDTFTASVEVSGGPVKAGASNSLSISAEVGKSTTRSRTVSLGTTDEVDAELKPGLADLVVMTALTGTVTVTAELRTYWDGYVIFERGGETTHPTATEIGHMLLPRDPHDTGGRLVVTADFGAAGEVDQTVVAIKSLAASEIARARGIAVSDRG